MKCKVKENIQHNNLYIPIQFLIAGFAVFLLPCFRFLTFLLFYSMLALLSLIYAPAAKFSTCLLSLFALLSCFAIFFALLSFFVSTLIPKSLAVLLLLLVLGPAPSHLISSALKIIKQILLNDFLHCC